jgi:hypothetical protein
MGAWAYLPAACHFEVKPLVPWWLHECAVAVRRQAGDCARAGITSTAERGRTGVMSVLSFPSPGVITTLCMLHPVRL